MVDRGVGANSPRGMPRHVAGAVAGVDAGALLPVVLVVAATVFNAILAVINGSVTPLRANHVMLAEVIIVALAQVCALANFNRRMLPWYAFVIVVAAFALLRMAAMGAFEVKYLRDMLLIQTFVVLGMSANMHRARQAFLLVTALIVAGILLEAISITTYSSLFQIKDFYINTRGLSSEEFTAKASELYVSAIRPEARYLPFFGLHRLSSVYLEPVTLGNYAILMICAALAFWSQLSLVARAFTVFACVLVLFACDGRLVMAVTPIILTAALFGRLIPANTALLIIPAVVVGAILIVDIGGLQSGRDNFAGRLAYTVELLQDMRAVDYFGFSDRLLEKSVDSGIVYLIITQSIFIPLALWILIATSLGEQTFGQRAYKNGICIFLGLTMLVSYSFVGIKTAAPLWFFYGALAAAAPDLAAGHSASRDPTKETATGPDASA